MLLPMDEGELAVQHDDEAQRRKRGHQVEEPNLEQGSGTEGINVNATTTIEKTQEGKQDDPAPALGALGAAGDVHVPSNVAAAAPGESENELHHYDQALVVVGADAPEAAAGCGTDAAVDSASFLAAVTSLLLDEGEVTLPRSWTYEAPEGRKRGHQVEKPSMMSAAEAEAIVRSFLADAVETVVRSSSSPGKTGVAGGEGGDARGEGAHTGGLIKKTRGRRRKSPPGKVARAADFAAAAAERQERMAVLSLPADNTLTSPAPLDPASLHSLSLWLSRYHAVRAPEPPTPASLDSILTDGPGPAAGVHLSPAAGGTYDAHVEVPASLLPKPVRRRGRPRKQDQVQPPEKLHLGGCTSGYLAAARLHDALVMKMYLCGGRWSAERPVVLNFPPAEALEMLSAPGPWRWRGSASQRLLAPRGGRGDSEGGARGGLEGSVQVVDSCGRAPARHNPRRQQ